jgi:hypothetical protein
MNKNRVERTSASDLTGQVQENASELVRSVGDVAGRIGYWLAARQNA